jgi:hypothetical protein
MQRRNDAGDDLIGRSCRSDFSRVVICDSYEVESRFSVGLSTVFNGYSFLAQAERRRPISELRRTLGRRPFSNRLKPVKTVMRTPIADSMGSSIACPV